MKTEATTWTKFWDMHSGGLTKVEPYDKIYIEADERVAAKYFFERFNRSPYNETCACCGPDYSVSEGTLAQLTGYHRDCDYDKDGYVERPRKQYDGSFARLIPLKEYMAQPDVLIIHAEEISESAKEPGEAPRGGRWEYIED